MAAAARGPRKAVLPLPGGEAGIGFDDIVFASTLGKVLAPGGRTGRLYLVDPSSRSVESVEGFSANSAYKGGHAFGATSADEAEGQVLVLDRAAMTLGLADPATGRVVASTAVASAPDYVRYVAPRHEAWVTEPDDQRIEVFAVSADTAAPSLTHAAFIFVEDGPESLAVDLPRKRAYTNLRHRMTMAIDINSHEVAGRWPNGCRDARGIALDAKAGFVFTACAEGKVVALDATRDGRMLSIADVSAGADRLAFSSTLRRLYVPGAPDGTLTALDVAADGKLLPVWTAGVPDESHCAAADDRGGVWVCDPARGRLLLFLDTKKP